MLSASNLIDIGRLFRAARKALGRTQAQVAHDAGLRRETILRIEAGENVDLITFLRAASALGKAIRLVDLRPDYDTVQALFHEN